MVELADQGGAADGGCVGLTDIGRMAAALTERVHRRLIELDDVPAADFMSR